MDFDSTTDSLNLNPNPASPSEGGQIYATVTDKAAENIRVAMPDDKPEAGLLVTAIPGGCSGMMYQMDVLDQNTGDFPVVETNGIKLFFPRGMVDSLSGITIDFVENAMGAGFQITNPNVQSGCNSCGSSC